MPNPFDLLSRTRISADNHRLGLLEVGLAAGLWGTTGVVVRRLHESAGLSALSIGCYRLVAAAAMLLVLAAPRLGRVFSALRARPVALIASGVGLAAYQVLYFVAVTAAGVGVATVVSLGIAPIVTLLWEAVLARRAPRPKALVVVVAALAGLALVGASGSAITVSAPHPVLGLLAATGSGFTYAATIMVNRHAAHGVSPLLMTTVATSVGALTLLPFALLAGATFAPTTTTVTELLYLGVATTVIAYGLFYAGLRTVAGSVAAVLTLLEPLTATALAVILLGEPLPAVTIVGAALLLGAVATLYLTPSRSTSADRLVE